MKTIGIETENSAYVSAVVLPREHIKPSNEITAHALANCFTESELSQLDFKGLPVHYEHDGRKVCGEVISGDLVNGEYVVGIEIPPIDKSVDPEGHRVRNILINLISSDLIKDVSLFHATMHRSYNGKEQFIKTLLEVTLTADGKREGSKITSLRFDKDSVIQRRRQTGKNTYEEQKTKGKISKREEYIPHEKKANININPNSCVLVKASKQSINITLPLENKKLFNSKSESEFYTTLKTQMDTILNSIAIQNQQAAAAAAAATAAATPAATPAPAAAATPAPVPAAAPTAAGGDELISLKKADVIALAQEVIQHRSSQVQRKLEDQRMFGSMLKNSVDSVKKHILPQLQNPETTKRFKVSQDVADDITASSDIMEEFAKQLLTHDKVIEDQATLKSAFENAVLYAVACNKMSNDIVNNAFALSSSLNIPTGIADTKAAATPAAAPAPTAATSGSSVANGYSSIFDTLGLSMSAGAAAPPAATPAPAPAQTQSQLQNPASNAAANAQNPAAANSANNLFNTPDDEAAKQRTIKAYQEMALKKQRLIEQHRARAVAAAAAPKQ